MDAQRRFNEARGLWEQYNEKEGRWEYAQGPIDARMGDAKDAASFGYKNLVRGMDGKIQSATDATGKSVDFKNGVAPERAALDRQQGSSTTPNYPSDAAAALEKPTPASVALNRTAPPAARSTTTTNTSDKPGSPIEGIQRALTSMTGGIAVPARPLATTTPSDATITGRRSQPSGPLANLPSPMPVVLAGTAADSAAAVRTMALADRAAKLGPLGHFMAPEFAQNYASGGNFDTARARADLAANRITADQYGHVMDAALAAGNAQPGVSDASRAMMSGRMTPAQQQQLSQEAQGAASAAYDRTHPGETAARGYKLNQADSTSQVVGPGGQYVNNRFVPEGSTITAGPRNSVQITPPTAAASTAATDAPSYNLGPNWKGIPTDAQHALTAKYPGLAQAGSDQHKAFMGALASSGSNGSNAADVADRLFGGKNGTTAPAATASTAPTNDTPFGPPLAKPTYDKPFGPPADASVGTRAAQSVMNSKAPLAATGAGAIDATTGAVGSAISNAADFATTLAGGTPATPQERASAGVDAVNGYIARNPSAATNLNNPTPPAGAPAPRMAGGYDLNAMGVPPSNPASPASTGLALTSTTSGSTPTTSSTPSALGTLAPLAPKPFTLASTAPVPDPFIGTSFAKLSGLNSDGNSTDSNPFSASKPLDLASTTSTNPGAAATPVGNAVYQPKAQPVGNAQYQPTTQPIGNAQYAANPDAPGNAVYQPKAAAPGNAVYQPTTQPVGNAQYQPKDQPTGNAVYNAENADRGNAVYRPPTSTPATGSNSFTLNSTAPGGPSSLFDLPPVTPKPFDLASTATGPGPLTGSKPTGGDGTPANLSNPFDPTKALSLNSTAANSNNPLDRLPPIGRDYSGSGGVDFSGVGGAGGAAAAHNDALALAMNPSGAAGASGGGGLSALPPAVPSTTDPSEFLKRLRSQSTSGTQMAA